jgi:hypothetical protein
MRRLIAEVDQALALPSTKVSSRKKTFSNAFASEFIKLAVGENSIKIESMRDG